ncbi:MAG: putative acyltransferase [Verrucomicrobiales bacterium]
MTTPEGRILSLDQFRGFTVLAMFFVNFWHGMEAVPRVFQHNENWFSLADWIMPGFLFAVGMSFRLTWQKRIEKLGLRSTVTGYLRRSLILILLSVLAFGFGSDFSHWSEWSMQGCRAFVAALLKARMWEVLAIIGASQMLLLPLIGRSTRIRTIGIVALLGIHAVLSQWFNVHFVLAQPNLLDAFWGAENVRAWDGGFFGVLNWAAITLAGTIAYDWLKQGTSTESWRRFLIAGCGCMVAGYALSCLSTLYDVTPAESVSKVAASPVIPSEIQGTLTFAEPPFTAIVPPEQRPVNYWMMSKRIVTLPFVLFAVGFVFAVLAAFVALCDGMHREFSVLRILGGNALAAFLLHYVIAEAMRPLVPEDSPLWFVSIALAVYLIITIGVMRALERQRLYLRL